MGDAWFRVEQTGWAAQPANGKGWAAILVYLTALLAWIYVTFATMGPSGINIAIFLVVTLVGTAVLVFVAMKRAEGTWAWQRTAPPEEG